MLKIIIPAMLLAGFIGNAWAETVRPRIGLVLGGGGARGAAHVGVLEVMEKLRIPVDCVAGTSMGSLVAGAYATGLTSTEMKQVIEEVKWEDIFSDTPYKNELSFRQKRLEEGFYTSLEMGVRDYELLPPEGFVRGQKIQLVFDRLVHSNQGEKNIENLPLPLSIIATDIGTGKKVVLREGKLTDAMRASMSVPGVMTPARINGQMLVDGGLVDNVPIGEARQRCQADVVIAVDVGTQMLKPDQITSVVSVAAQFVNILTDQNVTASLATLKESDIFIQPDLTGIGSGDFTLQMQAIERGHSAAEQAAGKLARYSVSEEAYAKWRHRMTADIPTTQPRIDEIQVTGLTYVNKADVLKHVQLKPGDTVDTKVIDQDLNRIYGDGYYQSVGYSLLTERERNILRITPLEKSWGPNYLRFGISLDVGPQNTSGVNIRSSYQQTWLNSLGAEWLTVAQLGQQNQLATNWYQPLDEIQRWFVQASAGVLAEQVGVFEDNKRVAQYNTRQFVTALEGGMNPNRSTQLKAGWVYRALNAALDTGSLLLPDADETLSGFGATLKTDTMDRLYFPTSGYKLDVNVFDARSVSAGELYTRGFAALEGVHSIGDYRLFGDLRWGGSLQEGNVPYYDGFYLGGPMNLSGYVNKQILGGDMAYAGLRLEKKVSPDWGGLYVGGMLETGRMNQRYSENQANMDGWLNSVGVYLGVDSLVGPIYLGFGYAPEGKSSSLFLRIGPH